MAITLLIVSCTMDATINNPNTNSISDIENGIYTPLDVRDSESRLSLYSTMELVRTVRNTEDLKDTDELIEYFVGDNGNIMQLMNNVKEETKLYESIGYEGYVNHNYTANNITENMKIWLLNFKNDVDIFIQTNPNEIDINRYFENVSNFDYGLVYSNSDLYYISNVLSNVLDVVKYHYLHYDSDSSSHRDPDCSFLENLGCTILFVAVIAAVIIAIYYVLVALYAALFVAVEGVAVVSSSTLFWPTVKKVSGLTEIIPALVTLNDHYKEYKNSFYEWCCGKTEEIICEPPSGAYIKEVSCGNFEYIIYGAGSYSTTFWGINENTTPSATVTSTSKLSFSVPNLGLPSKFVCNVVCINSDLQQEVYPWGPIWHDIESEDEFNLEWDQEPPNLIDLSELGDDIDASVYVSVNPKNTALYTYEWNSNFPEFYPYGSSASIELLGIATGSYNISVIVTNDCTDESQTISKSIIITD